MNRLLNFTRLYALVIGTVSSVTSVVLLDSMQKAFGGRGVAYVILLGLIGFVSVAIAWVIETCVTHSVRLRRLLVGSEFIEGIWWDVTVTDLGGPPHGTVIVVHYGEQGLEVNGTGYGVDGDRLSTFRSRVSFYQDRVMLCEYECMVKDRVDPIESGIMRLEFSTPADSYTGFYLDYTGQVHASVDGYLEAFAGTGRYETLNTESARRAFIHEKLSNAIEKYERRLPSDSNRRSDRERDGDGHQTRVGIHPATGRPAVRRDRHH